MIDRNETETTYGYNLYNSLTERRAKNPSAEKMECCDYYKYTPEGLLKSAISARNAKGISSMGMEEDGKLVQFIFRGDEIVAEEKDNNISRFIRGYDLIASDAESARPYQPYEKS